MLSCAMLVPSYAEAQHRGGSGNSRGTVSNTRGGERGTRSSSARPGGSTRPSQGMTSGKGSNKHGSAVNKRPGGNNNNRPGHGGGTAVRPGQGGSHGGTHQWGNNNRPGGSHNRPGINHNRPSGGHPGLRPGTTSAPRPGGWASRPRPHYDYRHPGYRPPRPGGGYWGAPLPNPYRVVYRVPPVPRYVAVAPGVPSLGTILGLTFGSFIDAGINSLYNAGYNVTGYLSDAVYLSNVSQMGYMWPEAMVRYTDGLMSGTQFYNWNMSADRSRYNSLYRQLTAMYGAPVDSVNDGSVTTTTWWAGGGTGYVTLQYGYGPSASGVYSYYTSLTYSAV